MAIFSGWVPDMPKRVIPAIIVVFLTLTFSSCSCVYFNTFHNIRKSFNSAEKSRRKSGREKASGTEVREYNSAITKASRVLERHPNSSYVDDALYIIGTSYYYLEEFDKSARKFKELFANYPKSEFIPRSRLMYAKAKIMLKEEAEAVVIFEEILEKETRKDMKANAARTLGQYYFDTKDYEQANLYFQALIDSLGDDSDKLRAYTFMADGYFDLFRFADAEDNYQQALDQGPDTLENYRIMYRMAECDYFLNNVSSGLDRLRQLADDELYYDSLPILRLMMAEGYERDGDVGAAMELYEKITVESPGTEAASRAYYYQGLIYQYDFEDLYRARYAYSNARKEKRGSDVYEDAARRASVLSLMEQYRRSRSDTLQADTVVQLNQVEIDQISENSFLLGELFYFELEKPDSALNILQALLEGYPTSRYAPQALMSMSFIYRDEYNDDAAADSLLRLVLSRYPHSDQSEKVIGLLGLAGTVADTGYPALTFARAEGFFEQFAALDSTRYYFQLMADSILADSLRIADSIRVADSIKAVDTTLIAHETAEGDDGETADSLILPVGASPSDIAGESVMTPIDSFAAPAEPDSVLVIDSVWALDSTWTFDSIWTLVPDTIQPIATVSVDSIPADTVSTVDSLLSIDSITVTDSMLIIDSLLVVDSSLVIDSLWVTAAQAALSLAAAEADSSVQHDYLAEAFGRASEKYREDQLLYLDSAYYYYRYVIDSFPLSEYSVQARYVLLYIYDNYLARGDSSLLELYGAFVDSFPTTPYAELIASEYSIRPLSMPSQKSQQRQPAAGDEDDRKTNEEFPETAERPDTAQIQSAESQFITDENGNTLPPAKDYFLREDVPFEYPLEAIAFNIQDKLYFRVRIDFAGEVVEVKFMNPTASTELNDRIIRTVENTRFDAGRIPPEMYDQWFYYTYTVVMPREYQP